MRITPALLFPLLGVFTLGLACADKGDDTGAPGTAGTTAPKIRG